jgi:D-alanyl-D-alanine-carboxypeptidase/D-alanyl-D-alanine-endopeptidase
MLALLLFSLALTPQGAVAPAAASLGTHAADWARSQKAGAVVTAERIGGRWQYALGGSPFPDGHAAVAPERVEFEIGSISKVFTGLLLAHAVHEGKLALTDTIALRLPLKPKSEAIGGITLKQLASHTSCLPRLPDNLASAAEADPYAGYDNTKLFAYLFHAKLAAAPPCAADYSNLGFGILGVVLESAYGKPWATLVREKITAPLGMGDTVQALSAEQRSRFAEPWSGDRHAAPWTFQAIAGAGALRSTAADLAKLADALIAGPQGPLAAVWPLLVGNEVEAPGLGGQIGLALVHDRVDGEDGYGHGGATGGYRSELHVFPKSGRAYVLLASNAEAQPEAWVAAWRAEGHAPVERKEVALPAAELGAYAGVYTLSPQARFTVLQVGDGLRVRLTGQTFLAIFASAKDEFFYRAVEAQISFRRDEKGQIAGLTLHQNGRDLPAPRSADPVPHVEFPTTAALAEYAGEYDFGRYQPGSTITVQAKGDVLGVQLTGQPVLPVFATAKDRFDYDVVVATLDFERDAAGKVVAVVLHQNGADMRAPRR